MGSLFIGLQVSGLFWVDSFHRANIGASSAVGTDGRVNYVNVTFGNRFNGALINAGSASGAIVRYFVSHDKEY